MERISSFDPVFAPDARILILGSMPSVASLAQGFYYAHPANSFWPILSGIWHADARDIPEKCALLKAHQIALWDVAASCERAGSLDSAIRAPRANDIPGLLRTCPKIRAILFNGATAEALFHRLLKGAGEGRTLFRMPSTSPAYTLPAAQKRAIWERAIKEALL